MVVIRMTAVKLLSVSHIDLFLDFFICGEEKACSQV